MKRDMVKTIKRIKGKDLIPTMYDMTVIELQQCSRMNAFDSARDSFLYGFILGARAQAARKVSKKVTA